MGRGEIQGRTMGIKNIDGTEKKRGCCLFLGLHKTSSSLHPLFCYIPPWHVQRTYWKARCALNTNKTETAGYWQANILLPSPVCRTETRQWLCIWQDRHSAEDTAARTDNKLIRADCLTQVALRWWLICYTEYTLCWKNSVHLYQIIVKQKTIIVFSIQDTKLKALLSTLLLLEFHVQWLVTMLSIYQYVKFREYLKLRDKMKQHNS